LTLFDECIEALGNPTILSDFESQNEFNRFREAFSFSFGRIDWSKIDNKETIQQISDILEKINERDGEFFIIWDNARLPVIKSNIEGILKALDDVLAVSFDTWLYRPEDGTIIEFFHEGEITIAIA